MSAQHQRRAVLRGIESIEVTEYNIELIARLERDALLQRTMVQRLSDTITRFVGSIPFVVGHLLLFAVWALINLELIPGLPAFDPYPFGLFTLLASAEGVFLAIFILISQNRMSYQADRRAHLSLQVSILAEQELTMILKMLQKVCDHLDVKVDTIKAQADELVKDTNVEELLNKIEEKLPGG